jgi:hypothetical protein
MTSGSFRLNVAIGASVLTACFVCPPLLARAPFRVTIPGTAFTVEGRGADVTVDDVGGGRRFRGKGFAKVIVRGTLQIPPSNVADPRMQRLVVHFRTSPQGPSLRSVEMRNGANTEFHLDTHLAGDYTTRETTQPESIANAWSFERGPVRVYTQTVLRLEVQFPGGFDSQINPGEFVLTSVVLDYPRK